MHNEALAEELWKRDEKNQTWEFVYFMKDGAFEGPHMDEVNPLLGYQDGFFRRGVMVIAEEKAQQVLKQLGGLASLFIEGSADWLGARGLRAGRMRPHRETRMRRRYTRIHSRRPRYQCHG